MITFSSHTLVKHGMPYIGKVLDRVAPFMEKCFVTVSEHTDDATADQINWVSRRYPNKFVLATENVALPSHLSAERQKQLRQTTSDWVMFVDDDDYWPLSSLYEMLDFIRTRLPKEAVAVANHPFQLTGPATYDPAFDNKWFTKWFSAQAGFVYAGPWPKDNIYDDGRTLTYRHHPGVVANDFRYFHLSYLKDHSFRDEEWAAKYKTVPASHGELPEEYRVEAQMLYELRPPKPDQ